MIKRRFFGIFGKVFLYTMLILLFVIGGMFLLFSNQIQSAIALTQQQQFSEAVMRFVEQTQGKTTDEIIVLTEDFHRWNSSLELSLINWQGEVLFQTDGFVNHIEITQTPNEAFQIISSDTSEDGAFPIISDDTSSLSVQRFQVMQQMAFLPLENGLHLQVDGSLSEASIYREILGGAAWVFVIITFISLLAAFFFAQQIAKPIVKVSSDTHMMSQLLLVEPPKERSDEIGQLSKDVYSMYSRLKSTIYQLETEIERVKQMEENQRYFFSAASHELKTPITAVGGIFEGILSDIITPEEYPIYLREGMKLVKEQTKLVTEILELVKLGGELPSLEKEPINLRQCLESVLEHLSPFIESKEQLFFEELLEAAHASGDSRHIADVESLGLPPQGDFGADWIDYLVNLQILAQRHGFSADLFQFARIIITSPYYTLRERIDFLTLTAERLSYQLPIHEYMYDINFHIRNFGTTYEVPVLYVMGELDRQTSYQLAKDFFEEILAPHKAFFTIPNAGHAPMHENTTEFNRVFIDEIRPLILAR